MEVGITNRPHEPAPAVVAQVEYTLGSEDYVEGYLFAWVSSLRKQIHIGVIALSVVAVAFILFLALFLWLILNVPEYVLLWLLAAIPLTASYAALVSQTYMMIIPIRKHYRRRHFRKLIEAQHRTGLVRLHRRDRVSMTAMGFTEVNEFFEADGAVRIAEQKEFDVQWSAVESIDVTDRLAVFTVTRKGLLFLPRGAFETESAFLRFVETAQELWRAYAPRQHGFAPSPRSLG